MELLKTLGLIIGLAIMLAVGVTLFCLALASPLILIVWLIVQAI